jgi:hypothetical protein
MTADGNAVITLRELAAQIIGARGTQRKVHYYGYEESDEWVAAKRIRLSAYAAAPLQCQVYYG